MPVLVRRLLSMALFVGYVVLLVEGGSYIFARYFYPRGERPDYQLPKWQPPPGYVGRYFSELHPWGVWHRENIEVTHELPCSVTTYRTNSYGARDDERARKSDQQRVLVLGDSFVEGFGVEKSARITEILEQKIRRPVLNFGTAGDFGPLQYRILYEQLASSFDHDAVILMILPDNDFIDNWYPYYRTLPEYSQRRYRPYYGPCGTDSCPVYPTNRPSEDRSLYQPAKFEDLSVLQKAELIWRHFSWTWSTYKAVLELRSPLYHRSPSYSGYRDATPAQIHAVLSSIIRIRELAGDRPVIVSLIPRPNDIDALRLAPKPLPVVEAFQNSARSHQFKFIDLSQGLLANEPDISKWFLSCDGHWSPLGHRLAAEILSASVSQALSARSTGAR